MNDPEKDNRKKRSPPAGYLKTLIGILCFSLVLRDWQALRQFVSPILPENVLTNVPNGRELLHVMYNEGLISNDDFSFLPFVLRNIQRHHLASATEALQKGDARPLENFKFQMNSKDLTSRMRNLGIGDDHEVPRRYHGRQYNFLSRSDGEQPQLNFSNTFAPVRNIPNREHSITRPASQERERMANGSAATAQIGESAEMPYEHRSENPRSFRRCSKCGKIQNPRRNLLQNLINILSTHLNEVQRSKLQNEIHYWYGVKPDSLEVMFTRLIHHKHIGRRCLICFLRRVLPSIGRAELFHAIEGVLAGDSSFLAALEQGRQNNGNQRNNIPNSPSSDVAGINPTPDTSSERTSHRSPSENDEQAPFHRYQSRSPQECCICLETFNDVHDSTDCVTLPCSHKVHKGCLVRHRLEKCPICQKRISKYEE